MKLGIEQGNLVLYITPMVYFNTINEWRREEGATFKFDLVDVYIDRDQYLERYALGVVLFGIGISLKVNYFDK